MKGLPILLAGLSILCSCEKYTLNRVYRANVLSNHGARAEDTVRTVSVTPRADTFVYVAAVLMPDSYDWRKDASYGAVDCTVQLWKGRELLHTFPGGPGTGVGSSPVSHHIAGGHLYTEMCTSSGTKICRDGTDWLSYGQREQLKGMLIKDGSIYTLGRNIDGGGFCFRKDGNPLLKQDSGEIFGDFSIPAYGQSGALYENGGAVCFSFRNASSCFIVRDGEIKSVATVAGASRVRDMRLYGQEIYYISDYTTSMIVTGPEGSRALPVNARWLTASLVPRGGEMWVCADSGDYTYCCPVYGNTGRSVMFAGSANLGYAGASAFYAVKYDGGGYHISNSDGETVYSRDSTYFLNTSALALAGDEVFALINPKEKECVPFVWHGGRQTAYEVNGYLTAIEVEISPPI